MSTDNSPRDPSPETVADERIVAIANSMFAGRSFGGSAIRDYAVDVATAASVAARAEGERAALEKAELMVLRRVQQWHLPRDILTDLASLRVSGETPEDPKPLAPIDDPYLNGQHADWVRSIHEQTDAEDRMNP